MVQVDRATCELAEQVTVDIMERQLTAMTEHLVACVDSGTITRADSIVLMNRQRDLIRGYKAILDSRERCRRKAEVIAASK